jgi:hypothetical protein
MAPAKPDEGHRMRKLAGALFASAMMLPLGLIASPAGAVAGATCKTLSGTAKLSPALPGLEEVVTAKPTVTIKGAMLGGCSGGVTSGTLSATLKFGQSTNCLELTLPGGVSAAKIKGTATVAWNTKSTSTLSFSIVNGPKVKGHDQPSDILSIPGTVTAGKFKGSKVSGILAQNQACLLGHATVASFNFKQLSKIAL